MTHDYKRNGVTTLFSAMNMLTGQVLSMTEQLHRHQEWLRFLKLIDCQPPKTKELHLVVDNYATHKHPEVQAWLAKHPRFHMHFTPTSSSWLNMVERFFRDITDKQIRPGVFRSVPDLEAAIEEYIAAHNANPKPFIWSAPGDRQGVKGASPGQQRHSESCCRRVMRVASRGATRSADRSTQRPAIEPRLECSSGCPRCSKSGRQHDWARHRKHPADPAWSMTLACAHAPCTGTGRSLV
jgi:hypothetical protein